MEYLNQHQDLIDLCRKRDQKAQFQLYRLYYKNMYNTSYRIVADTAEAEDVMQEAFLSAFEKIETYSGKVSFGAWLKRIVVNQSLDCLRKKRQQFVSIEENTPEIKDETENYDLEEEKFKIELVQKAIEELPEGYRVVLSLHLLEGYDHQEISEILGITNSTARSQYARAKQKLLVIIKDKKHTQLS